MSAEHRPTAAPTCVRCDYNLTGLPGNTCPECGWCIDWRLAALDKEQRRSGTPAHRATGWRVLDQTALTVLLMLFAPWRFARQLRYDERLWPALSVAFIAPSLSLAVWWVFNFQPDHWLAQLRDFLHVLPVYVSGAITVMMCDSLAFATLHRDRSNPAFSWRRRLRFWVLVSLYSTCFVGAWPLTEVPWASPLEANFVWVGDLRVGLWSKLRDSAGVTLIFYWWWMVLGTVLLLRNRPRWLVLVCVLLVYLSAWGGSIVGSWAYALLGEGLW